MSSSLSGQAQQHSAEKPQFWPLHILGWLAYVLIFAFDNIVFSAQYNKLGVGVITPLLIIGLMAATLTYPLRAIYQRCWALPTHYLGLVIVTCSLLVATIWTPFKNLVLMWFSGSFSMAWQYESPLLLLATLSYSFFMVLVWSCLYFGINYHFRLLEEKEQHLKAVRLSHSAQIKMLRYQINPHFLFNTLNAISTLVLKGSKERANGMLTRLSTFLRFSLDNDPEKKIRLYEELKALMLYLEIEKTRFDERLEVQFHVEPETEALLVPSLLLQPLVENAIKYAIAKMARGGLIEVSAQVSMGRLQLQVADNGPFDGTLALPDINMQPERKGVGLGNIRERLRVLYPHEHQFSMEKREPHGLLVVIQIPMERA